MKEVNNYISKNTGSLLKYTQITDESKLGQNRAGVTFVVLELHIVFNKRINDNLTVYTRELFAFWIKLNKRHQTN